MALNWLTPIRLTGVPDSSTNDVYGMVENHMCVLDSGIVVVGGLSSDSYAIHYWAIDLSGDTPRVGPDTYFNSQYNSWASLTDDPKLRAVGDMNDIVALGSYRFGMTGEADQSYTSGGAPDDTVAGTHGHIASLYTVDPTTLAITRDHFVVGPWATSEAVESEATVSRWGDKMIITRDRDNYGSPNNYIWIVSADGTYTTIGTTLWSDLSVPVVSGSSCYLFGHPKPAVAGYNYHLLRADLNAGTITDLGAKPGIFDNNWTWFGTLLANGDPIWLVSDNGSGSYGPVWTYTRELAGGIDHYLVTGANGRLVGFTGGWYSNIRDIHQLTNGDVMVSYSETTSRKFMYKLIRDGAPVETAQIANFYEPPYPAGYNYPFSARTGALPGGHACALWVSHTYNGGGSNYGLYFAHTGVPTIIRNLVINPSGEQSFDRAWIASNGAVETNVTWEA